jgi:hypothetical protein
MVNEVDSILLSVLIVYFENPYSRGIINGSILKTLYFYPIEPIEF